MCYLNQCCLQDEHEPISSLFYIRLGFYVSLGVHKVMASWLMFYLDWSLKLYLLKRLLSWEVLVLPLLFVFSLLSRGCVVGVTSAYTLPPQTLFFGITLGMLLYYYHERK